MAGSACNRIIFYDCSYSAIIVLFCFLLRDCCVVSFSKMILGRSRDCSVAQAISKMILARSRDRAVAQTFKSPNFQPPFSLPDQRFGFVVDKVPLGQMLLEETQPCFTP
jgi:hypothetical protein